MRIRKRPLLLALPLAAAGLGIGVVPTLAAHAAHAGPATVRRVTPCHSSRERIVPVVSIKPVNMPCPFRNSL